MKNLKNLGKTLTKAEQKTINGGGRKQCNCDSDCSSGQWCCYGVCTLQAQAGYCPSQPCGDLELDPVLF